MNLYRLFFIFGFCLVFVGCQSWQRVDFESLPPTAALPTVSSKGEVEIRYFDGIRGTLIESLLESPKFPDHPDEVGTLTQLERPTGRGDNYGSYVRGYIMPPITGEYRFFVSGDDQTKFFLSDSTLPSGLRLIAQVPDFSPIKFYEKYSAQTSGLISLEGGSRYYFELIHKEAGGSDHFSVSWEGPGIQRSIIGSENLYSKAESLYPEDEASQKAYALGYRVGFFDGSKGLRFSPSYPPLDKDQDGLYDNWEIYYGLDPNDPSDANVDHDGDLLTALDEFWLGTNPVNPDTSGDGLTDGEKFAYGLDPLDPSDLFVDIDGVGVVNLYEFLHGSDLDYEFELVQGFIAQYFRGINFDQFVFSRNDEEIKFNWGGGSPDSRIPNDRFSVRWFSKFLPPHTSVSNVYRIFIRSDDGARVIINGDTVIDAWRPQAPTTYNADVSLSASEEHRLQIDYFESTGGAQVEFWIIDQRSGERLSKEFFQAVRIEDGASGQLIDTDNDGIPDIWELKYGLNPWVVDSQVVFNSSGISAAEAYSSALHPWTLEEVETPGPTGGVSAPPVNGLPNDVAFRGVTLSWVAPSTRVDGSGITLSEISHYEIFYGQNESNLSMLQRVSGESMSYTFQGLSSGMWFFSVRVVDNEGLTSERAPLVSYMIP